MNSNFFADSDFLTGLLAKRDSRHDISQKIFDYLIETKLISSISDFHISNYIIMEVIHNLQGKKIPFVTIVKDYNTLIGCHVFQIKPKEIDLALQTKLAPYCNHRTHNPPPIGLVDATSLVVMDKKRINSLISFDEGFGKLPDIFIRVTDTDVIDQRILSYYK
jgi:predicted nucleic acid-binding protein